MKTKNAKEQKQEIRRDITGSCLAFLINYLYHRNFVQYMNHNALSFMGLVIFLYAVYFAVIAKSLKRGWFWAGVGFANGLLIFGSLIHPYVGIGLGAFILAMLMGLGTNVTAPKEIAIRGQALSQSAPEELIQKTGDRDPGVFWGGITLPSEMTTRNFLVNGTVGSGKSLTFGMFMQTIFQLFIPGSNRRALVFDPKTEVYPIVKGIHPHCDIHILNPLDQRCAKWDMAQDITNPVAAQEMANILVPLHHGEKDTFWRDTVATLMEGLIVWFIINAPGAWELRDIVLIMQNEELLRAILSSDRRTNHYLDVLGESRTAANIRATLSTKMRPYTAVAACWHRATKKVSLEHWMQYGGVIILGDSATAQTAIRALSQIIFTRAGQLVLEQPEQQQGKGYGATTYLLMDEAPAMGKLNLLKTLATEGRSKGLSITLGFQDIEDMQYVYGREEANTIMGQINCKSFLRLSSPKAAEWASSAFSEREFMEQSYGESTSNKGLNSSQSTNVNWRRTTSKVVMPIEFLSIPWTGPENGLTGFHQIYGNSFKHTMSWNDIQQRLPKPSRDPAFIPRSKDDYWLEPFNRKDRYRLNLDWLDDDIIGIDD